MTAGHPDGLVVVGFGAGSLDLFPPVGEQGGKVLDDGQKGDWDDYAQQVFDDHTAQDRADVEEHVGGNGANIAVGLKLSKTLPVARLSFVTLYGRADLASTKIRAALEEADIEDRGFEADGARASVGVVNQREPGADRTVKGFARRGRLSEQEGFTPSFVEEITADADIVYFASLKDMAAARRIAENTDPRPKTFKVAAFGSSEFDKPDEILRFFSDYPDYDFAPLNTEEAASLTNLHGEETSLIVTKLAGLQLAKRVMVTDGTKGLWLIENGDAEHADVNFTFQPAERVPPEEMGSTIGAGDAAAAMAIEELVQGESSSHDMLRRVAAHTAVAVRYRGAHAHLLG